MTPLAVIAVIATAAITCLPVTLAALCWLYDRHKNRRRVSGTPLLDRGVDRRFDQELADIRNLPVRRRGQR